MRPRFRRPFSIHGIKRPIAACKDLVNRLARENICDYQNYFLQRKYGLEFWLDKQMNKDGVFAGDTYLKTQISQNTQELDANFIKPEKLEKLY